MSTISQQQRNNGPRRAFGQVINPNQTPKKSAKAGGGSSIADEVHSAKKEKSSSLAAAGLFNSMATRSSKKRDASLKEADDDTNVSVAMEVPTKMLKTTAISAPVAAAAAAAAVLPKAVAANSPLKGGGDNAGHVEVFRNLPEVNAAFWDEMEDLLEIKLANPICSEDEFDVKESDEDEQDNVEKEAASGDL